MAEQLGPLTAIDAVPVTAEERDRLARILADQIVDGGHFHQEELGRYRAARDRARAALRAGVDDVSRRRRALASGVGARRDELLVE